MANTSAAARDDVRRRIDQAVRTVQRYRERQRPVPTAALVAVERLQGLLRDMETAEVANAQEPPYAEDKEARCTCGHERAVHAGHDGLGRCALRSCPTICGQFRRA